MKDFTIIQRIELGAYAVAGFCGIVAPTLAPTHPILAAVVAGTGAAAVAVKAYLSSSPKDGAQSSTSNQPPTQ